jgi:hypothetical protein
VAALGEQDLADERVAQPLELIERAGRLVGAVAAVALVVAAAGRDQAGSRDGHGQAPAPDEGHDGLAVHVDVSSCGDAAVSG